MNGRIFVFVISVLVLWFSSIVAGCPSGWISHGTKCYHFSHDLENWPDAMVMCRMYGGYLAEIITASENTFLTGYTQNQGSKKWYWVGAADSINEREWIWMTSKTPMAYKDWLPGQPTNSGGNENCMMINYSGHWNDAPCKSPYNYVCEIEIE